MQIKGLLQKSKTWFVGVSFKTELLSEYLIHKGYVKYMKPVLGLNFNLNNRKIVDNDICGVKEEYDEFAKIIKKDYKKIIPELFRKIEKVSKEFIELVLPLNLDKLTNPELLMYFQKFTESYSKAAGQISVPVVCEMVMTDVMKKKIPPSTTESEFFSKIAFTEKDSTIAKERSDLLKSKNIQEHVNNYKWVFKTLFLGDDYTIEMAREESVNLKAYKDILMRKDEESKNLKQFIKEHNISMELKEDIQLFQDLIYFRDVRLEWLTRGCENFKPLIIEISKRINANFSETIYLLPQEIEKLLKRNEKADIDMINQRKKKYALITENGNTTLYIGEEVEINRVEAEKRTNKITGICASKGRAEGIAKILKDRDDLSKVEEGDIIIARLTTPDFIIAMKKAAAMVTDIGGLTSHAAIMSRELGIPCVIGTKIATKVLKDGDIIEVDANRGIVSKVKD